MGVQGLWTLLEPVGRRINIEALANKRLAVGTSSVCSCMRQAITITRDRRFHLAHPVYQSHAR